MKKVCVVPVAAFVLATASPVYASVCSDYQRDRAEYYAQSIGRQIVSGRYKGGSDIRTVLTSCNYNSYSKKYDVGVSIYWKGLFFSSNEYNSDGTINMNETGEGYAYTEKYTNEALTKWKAFQKAKEFLENSAASSPSSLASAGTKIWVKNNCSSAVNHLWVRFKDASSDRWKVYHFTNFSAGQASYLNDENQQRLRAAGDYIEYATDPVKNATDDTFTADGRTRQATTLYGVASDGDRNIYLCGR